MHSKALKDEGETTEKKCKGHFLLSDYVRLLERENCFEWGAWLGMKQCSDRLKRCVLFAKELYYLQ